MEYKHEFLDEINYLPEVNVWLDRYYSDSVRTYLDRFDQRGYSRSFFLDENNMDGEKQTDLDFIYKSTLFYEEYFKSLLDSSLIDDTNKSFIVSGIEKIKQMNIYGGEWGYGFPCAIDKFGGVNVSGNFIRGGYSDDIVKEELYNPLNFTLFDKFYTDFYYRYSKNTCNYSFLGEPSIMQDNYVKRGLLFFNLGLACYTTDYIINNGKSMPKPKSFCFDGMKSGYLSYSEEAINAVFMVGKALFPQYKKKFSLLMPEMIKFFMNNDSFQNYFSAFGKMGKSSEAVELFLNLGIVSELMGKAYSENEELPMYDASISRIYDICVGEDKKNKSMK